MTKKSPEKIVDCSKKFNLKLIIVTANFLFNFPSVHNEIETILPNKLIKEQPQLSILNSSYKLNIKETKENDFLPEKREIDDAVTLGLKDVEDLIGVKEQKWYRMGLFLSPSEPASAVANFGKPGKKAQELLKFGYSSLEISKRISELYPPEKNEKQRIFSSPIESRVTLENCPFRGTPRCSPSSKFYRTSDGTCNNPIRPWWGSALLPMERFLPPVYNDDIETIRKSSTGASLPSARDISITVHRDKNRELPTLNLMFMQWGQFIDHDLVSTVKSRSFNGSIPRCCDQSGREFLPPNLLHPSCLPIPVSDDDWFLGRFGIRCLEFTRSAPATRINCDLGWREQINQATSYLDASNIYGSDIETTDSIRTFRNGKLQYGRPLDGAPLHPPDPPGGELCRSGALSTDCFPPGDSRFGEQIGLTAIHTTWVRYHNRLATTLGKLNKHWDDEKLFQETRRIIGAMIQHITYKEFLPIVLGAEVMELFELDLSRKKFYNGYNEKINPGIANSFGAAAFRFGHSLVQNTYMRFDSRHRPIFHNISLHQEVSNVEHIWSFGSVDRLMLGFSNQPCQRRDEFMSEELTNNLFRHPRAPFGIDLAAINIQRGRDHGLPPYVSWRKPCGLTEITNWQDLQKVTNVETVQRLKFLYENVEDIDLFTAGLAEKPVRGGILGPTFACIVAQQFSNLRKGDRFWYENGDLSSSFTPAQLQQIRRISFAEVLCQTMRDIRTIQPFVFLAPDNLRNERLSCDGQILNRFDLASWTEDFISNDFDHTEFRHRRNLTDIFDDNSTKLNTTKDDDHLKYKQRQDPNIPLANIKKNSNKLNKNVQIPSKTANKFHDLPLTNYKLDNFTELLTNKTLLNTLTSSIQQINNTQNLSKDNKLNQKITEPNKDLTKTKVKRYVETDDYYSNEDDEEELSRYYEEARKRKRVTVRPITKPTRPPIRKTQTPKLKIPITNVTLSTIHVETKYHNGYESYNDGPDIPHFYQGYTTRKPYKIKDRNDFNYLLSVAQSSTKKPKTAQTPLEVNIKIQYYPPTEPTTNKRKKQKVKNKNTATSYPIYVQQNTERPTYMTAYHDNYYQQPDDPYRRPYRPLTDDIYVIKRPVVSKRPSVIFTNQDHYGSASEMSQYPNILPYEPYHSTSSEHPQYENYYQHDETDYHQYQPVEVTTKKIYNSIYYHTHKPSPVNIYNHPSGDGYIDDIDRLFDEDKDSSEKDSGLKGTSYSIAYIEKLSSPNSDDKLDFKTKFVYKRVKRKRDDLKAELTETDGPEMKEGGLELDDFDGKLEKIQVVDLKILSKENMNAHWSVFNENKESDDDTLEMVLPDFNKNISCSDEIPSKLKIGKIN